MRFGGLVAAAVVVGAIAGTGELGAQNGGRERFELGLRLDIVAADGEPTNDMLGGGLLARFPLNDRWRIGVALDHSPGFDVERPYEFLGLVGDPTVGEIDAEGSATTLSGWIERDYRGDSRWEWFWGGGLGVELVDVDELVGPIAGGGTYEITEDVGTQLVALGLAGARLRIGERSALEMALRVEQHFANWKVTDRASGRTKELDDYLVSGVHFAWMVRW